MCRVTPRTRGDGAPDTCIDTRTRHKESQSTGGQAASTLTRTTLAGADIEDDAITLSPAAAIDDRPIDAGDGDELPTCLATTWRASPSSLHAVRASSSSRRPTAGDAAPSAGDGAAIAAAGASQRPTRRRRRRVEIRPRGGLCGAGVARTHAHSTRQRLAAERTRDAVDSAFTTVWRRGCAESALRTQTATMTSPRPVGLPWSPTPTIRRTCAHSEPTRLSRRVRRHVRHHTAACTRLFWHAWPPLCLSPRTQSSEVATACDVDFL